MLCIVPDSSPEMLCIVPDSSPEKMIVDEDESLDNQEHQGHVSVDEEFSQTESQSICFNTDDNVCEDEEMNSDTIVDHLEILNSEIIESVENTESSARGMLFYEIHSSTEKMVVDEDELPNLYNKIQPSLENQEHPKQLRIEEEFSQTESQSMSTNSDFITQSGSEIISLNFEHISATVDDVIKDEELNSDNTVEFLDDTSDSESEKSLISIYQLRDDESTSQLSPKSDESVEVLTKEYKISMELTDDDETMDQLCSECEIPVERITDENQTSPNYSNLEDHLQEINHNCDKKDYIHDNNNIAGFCTIELNNHQNTFNNGSYKPITGDFVEAYVNYIRSEAIPATKQVNEMHLPFDVVMSPPSTPDSTSQPVAVTKKRGRPKGSKNQKKPSVRTVPTVVERFVVHSLNYMISKHNHLHLCVI